MADPMPLRCEIFEMMREYVGANLAKKVTNVVDVLKLAAQVEDFPPVTDRIALANGTLYLDGTFQEGKPEIVRNRLPDGLPIAPELLTKWYRLWRAEHPEFEQIVFHGLRHSSATYQLLQSDGDFKSVQGNTGHATACRPDGHLCPHAGQAPVGADREDRSKLLLPRPDPDST